MQQNTFTQTILITDVTRMSGEKVCIAGIDKALTSIRPVTSYPGVIEDHLFRNKTLIIYPGAVVKFEFVRNMVTIEKPHTEDIFFNPGQTSFEKDLSQETFFECLEKTKFNSIDELFEGKVQNCKFITDNTCSRSIGTIIPVKYSVEMFKFVKDTGECQPRLKFKDDSGKEYSLAITDLRIKKLSERNNLNCDLINSVFNNEESKVALRIGLTRWWTQPETEGTRCSLQVTGIYTMPDYTLDTLHDLIDNNNS